MNVEKLIETGAITGPYRSLRPQRLIDRLARRWHLLALKYEIADPKGLRAHLRWAWDMAFQRAPF